MRIGLVAEFNPLHSGHKFLIDEAKNLITQHGSGELICVMSEFFTQRGEAAIINGYKRAEVAIKAGCDLILALPYRASVAYSDDFAYKSIEILVKCGITHLIFGTEEDIANFEQLYNQEQLPENKILIKEKIKMGLSYPKIMSELFKLKINPNFTLAYSYFKALKTLAPHVKLIAVKRQGQTLNEDTVEQKKHLSATAIRKNFSNELVKNYLDLAMLEHLENSPKLNEENFYSLLRYKILTLTQKGIKDIYDVSEGLENRIYEAALVAQSHKELMHLLATKRYSNKRLQRILLNILTNSTRAEMQAEIKHVRALAVKKGRTALIREINNTNNIYIHQKLKKDNSTLFDHDIRVSRIYNLLSGEEDIFKHRINIVD